METRRNIIKLIGLGTAGLIISPVIFAKEMNSQLLKKASALRPGSQSPVLTAVNCTLTTGSNNGAGLDHDSILIFVLHPTNDGRRAAEYQFYGNDATGGTENEGNVKHFDLKLHTNSLTRNQINNKYSIDIIIHAVGRDHYNGHLECIFHFDDSSIGGFDYTFGIGTFHESNQTGKVISFS